MGPMQSVSTGSNDMLPSSPKHSNSWVCVMQFSVQSLDVQSEKVCRCPDKRTYAHPSPLPVTASIRVMKHHPWIRNKGSHVLWQNNRILRCESVDCLHHKLQRGHEQPLNHVFWKW